MRFFLASSLLTLLVACTSDDGSDSNGQAGPDAPPGTDDPRASADSCAELERDACEAEPGCQVAVESDGQGDARREVYRGCLETARLEACANLGESGCEADDECEAIRVIASSLAPDADARPLVACVPAGYPCSDGDAEQCIAQIDGAGLALASNTCVPPGWTAIDHADCDLLDMTDPPDRCRSPCELATSCDTPALDDYPSLDETRQAWSAGCAGGEDAGICQPCPIVVVEGRCAQELTFVHQHNGTVGEVRYFDASGLFVGLATSTDDVDQTCLGQSFWPEPIACDDAVVNAVPCGQWPQGGSITLPWADGSPADPPFSVP